MVNWPFSISFLRLCFCPGGGLSLTSFIPISHSDQTPISSSVCWVKPPSVVLSGGPVYVSKAILFSQLPNQSRGTQRMLCGHHPPVFNTRIWVWTLWTLSLVSLTDSPLSFFRCQVHLFPKSPSFFLLDVSLRAQAWGPHISLGPVTVRILEMIYKKH